MKCFVNMPEDTSELNIRIAKFHATLLLEKIRQTNVNDMTKQKLLNLILEKLKNNESMSNYYI